MKGSGTVILLKKLTFLTVMGTFDCWKLILSIRNFLKTVMIVSPNAEMTALCQLTADNRPAHSQIITIASLSNILEMLAVCYLWVERLIRISFRACAIYWKIKEKSSRLLFFEYVLGEMVLQLGAVVLVNYFAVYLMNGIYIRRRRVFVKDTIEIIVVNVWIVILSGLAGDEPIERWILFLMGLVAVVQGYIAWGFLVIIDRLAFAVSLENNEAFKAVFATWDFAEEDFMVSVRNNWEVTNTSAFGSSVVLMDINVGTKLPMDHVIAIAHLEMAHWKFRHSIFNYVVPIMKSFALASLLMFAYDNRIIVDLFGFTGMPERFLPVFLAYSFIWPQIRNIFRFIDSLLSYWTVLRSDSLAKNVYKGDKNNLVKGLYGIAGATEHFPIYDGWYSAWILGRPTIYKRIANLLST